MINVNCEDCWGCSNCMVSVQCKYCENLYRSRRCKLCIDGEFMIKSKYCNNCKHCYKCYKSDNLEHCSRCRHCKNLRYAIKCIELMFETMKEYFIENKQVTQKQYQDYIAKNPRMIIDKPTLGFLPECPHVMPPKRNCYSIGSLDSLD